MTCRLAALILLLVAVLVAIAIGGEPVRGPSPPQRPALKYKRIVPKRIRPMTFDNGQPEPVLNATVVVYDAFTRADTVEPSIGTPPTGNAWTHLGANWNAPTVGKILNNAWVTSTAGIDYGCQTLDKTPCIMEGTVRWDTDTGLGSDQIFVMAAGTRTGSNWAINSVHLRCYRASVALDTFVAGVLGNLGSAEFSALALATSHTFKLVLFPAINKAQVYVNGVLVLSVTHATIGTQAGKDVFWEHYNDAVDTTAKLSILDLSASVDWAAASATPPVANANSLTFTSSSPVIRNRPWDP